MYFKIIVTLCVAALATMSYADAGATKKVEENYLSTLDAWVKRGGPVNEVQEAVVKTCGKYVMLTASATEKAALSTTQREEFDYRVDVCVKMTINRVHPQPEFEKREIVKMICDESQKVALFKKLCKRSGLR